MTEIWHDALETRVSYIALHSQISGGSSVLTKSQ